VVSGSVAESLLGAALPFYFAGSGVAAQVGLEVAEALGLGGALTEETNVLKENRDI